MKDLSVSNKTIKLLEENIGVKLCDLKIGNGFLNIYQSTSNKRKIDNCTSSKF